MYYKMNFGVVPGFVYFMLISPNMIYFKAFKDIMIIKTNLNQSTIICIFFLSDGGTPMR